jgi:leucyl-tRNA synthetase
MRLVNQGMILGEDNQKMSKSRGNVINPDDIVREFGADSMRVYEMFMGPLEVSKPWATAGLIGVSRFLEKTWALSERPLVDAEPSRESLKALNKTVKKVDGDTSSLNFNTAISAMMIYVNELGRIEALSRSLWEPLILMLAPYAPHLAEELWERAGHTKSLVREAWPTYDDALCADESKEIVVQVNGKIRERFSAASGTLEAQLEATALSLPKVLSWTQGKRIAKVVVVKDKLVNIVLLG